MTWAKNFTCILPSPYNNSMRCQHVSDFHSVDEETDPQSSCMIRRTWASDSNPAGLSPKPMLEPPVLTMSR